MPSQGSIADLQHGTRLVRPTTVVAPATPAKPAGMLALLTALLLMAGTWAIGLRPGSALRS
jgi:hypothetical protein